MNAQQRIDQLYQQNNVTQNQTQEGNQYWLDRLASGASPETVSREFSSAVAERQQQQPQQPQGQYGLSGMENAVMGGYEQGRSDMMQGAGRAQGRIGTATQRVKNALQQARRDIAPYGAGGQQAAGLQAQLSGAMGGDAQRQAMNSTMNSPEFDFIREQGNRAVMANSAATGGTGGGEVMRDLTRFGQGLASQRFDTAYNRLGQVANRGQNVGSGLANIQTNAAGKALGIGQAQAGIDQSLGSGLATMAVNTGNRIGGARLQAGRDIASQLSGRSDSMANLVNQQSSSLSDLLSRYGSGAGQLMNEMGNAQAQSLEQRGQLLQALATGNTPAGMQAIGNAGQTAANADLARGGIYGDLINQIGGGVGTYLGQQPQQASTYQGNPTSYLGQLGSQTRPGQ